MDIDKYDGIDQVRMERALTVLVVHLYKMDHLLPQSWTRLHKSSGVGSWFTYWRKLDTWAQEDLASCLDNMVSRFWIRKWSMSSCQLIGMMIGSSGHSENLMNKHIAGPI